MSTEQHIKEVEKFNKLENELIEMIAEIGNEKLMQKFQEWQDQRHICNKGFFDHIESLKTVMQKKRK